MRPKSFNEDDVLQTIEETFRRVGYDGASLDVLTRATGLNRSSLYNAFGCKRDMMVRAMTSYTARTCANIEDDLSGRPFREALRSFFSRISEPDAHGCLVGNLAAERAEADSEDRSFFAGRLDELEAIFAAAIVKAQTDGEISATADPAMLARYIMTTVQGLRIVGQIREDDSLRAGSIDLALAAIPFTDSRRSETAQPETVA